MNFNRWFGYTVGDAHERSGGRGMINPKVYAKKILPDIEDGLGDIPIMEKHGISPSEYLSVLDELKGIESARKRRDRQVRQAQIQMRGTPRCYIFQDIAVYDADRQEVRGSVNDVTTQGLQVSGIPSEPGNRRNFVLASKALADDPSVMSSVTFEAECRWVRDEDAYGEYVAGYEITRITDKDREKLSRIIQELAFCDDRT
jgi:hypothetical protein